ncbi:hypothetical protein BN1723_013997 [Verticillium longisporum]|uniref:Uncharacterized protein n=1 Tax=Verticillium longisporum TaxID=100787 RepID=A0A0G4LZW0_VERLO|nr:hypothetical protein BN1723_013997 [Verticillium longisporum]
MSSLEKIKKEWEAHRPKPSSYRWTRVLLIPALVAPQPYRHRRPTDVQAPMNGVPPSRFQKRKGSIYATPGSRDGHVDRNYASGFHEKHTEKGYGKADAKH